MTQAKQMNLYLRPSKAVTTRLIQKTCSSRYAKSGEQSSTNATNVLQVKTVWQTSVSNTITTKQLHTYATSLTVAQDLNTSRKNGNTWQLIMLPKPKTKNILSTTDQYLYCKIFERLILNHLQIVTSHIIRPEQFGFCPKHSTITQLLNTSTKLNRKIKTAIKFLDIEKAFD